MNLNEITKKCFILALFIRDDAQRFLLGSGAYEFKESQLHFAANTMTNDVVEVQGNDGYLLAGQVRRPTTQVFDGYIGDASVNKQDIEGYRRDFFEFFQKNHFYTVVYVFPDGSAIQRRRGFIVDCAEVKELWQIFPEYHIGLNFEDVNYYKYSENSQGQETYGKSAEVSISSQVFGGLVWDDGGLVPSTLEREGNPISFDGTIAGGAIESVEMYGDTEQQTYSGKNLFNTQTQQAIYRTTIVSKTDNELVLKPTASGVCYITYEIPVEPSTQYTFSWLVEKTGFASNFTGMAYINAYNGSASTYLTNIIAPITTRTFTTLSDTTRLRIQFYPLDREDADYEDAQITYYNLQLEKGSTATDYEKYVGGVPSPNPDYPQDVEIVTGEQTIVVSDGASQSQSLTVDLGAIELCKIGTYQDYIYKSGGDWYIHKETGKLELDGTENYTNIYSNPNSTDYYYVDSNAFDSATVAGYTSSLSDRFKNYNNWFIYSTAVTEEVYSFGGNAAQKLRFMIRKDRISSMTTAAVKSWFASNPTTIHYALGTPTDTQITDNTLIGQLEAVLGADTYDGQTVISGSASGESPILKATVSVLVMQGGVEWDSYGAIWEAGGGGDATVVAVDSIDTVYPVWTVVGPTDNPILTNLTTGTAIHYNGNISSTQTLVVDMLNQTAELNGTSVIGRVSGDWLEFVPGNNRIVYTADNSTAPNSTIEWQEIVG